MSFPPRRFGWTMASFNPTGAVCASQGTSIAAGRSQAHLAELTGLSVRTIQRIETGANPGLESLRGIAAVFAMDVSELQAEVDAAPRGSAFFRLHYNQWV